MTINETVTRLAEDAPQFRVPTHTADLRRSGSYSVPSASARRTRGAIEEPLPDSSSPPRELKIR
jgi:hypothetical protein